MDVHPAKHGVCRGGEVGCDLAEKRQGCRTNCPRASQALATSAAIRKSGPNQRSPLWDQKAKEVARPLRQGIRNFRKRSRLRRLAAAIRRFPAKLFPDVPRRTSSKACAFGSMMAS